MEIQEIRENCIESAKRYYQFLEENKKGISTIEVRELKQHDNRYVFKIRLASRIFDPEAIFFKIRGADRLYTIEEIKIVEYDTDKNILIVKPLESVLPLFSNLRYDELQIISDLKFLVKRVEIWFQTKGMNVLLPQKSSPLLNTFDKIKYLPGSEPSSKQKEALKSVFTQPFTYIWGAPGTGKTQFVLAYAILHYLELGKKVAIVAPTNNSIEQVLFGVLKIAEKAGIDTRKFLRLGSPTKKFAEAYPEVCEERGVQKQLDELNNQIDRLGRMMNHLIVKGLVGDLQGKSVLFSGLEEKLRRLSKQKDDLQTFRKTEARNKVELDAIESKLGLNEELQVRFEKKRTTFGHRIRKWFSKKTAVEQRIEQLQTEYLDLKSSSLLANEDYLTAAENTGNHRDLIARTEKDTGLILSKIVDTFSVHNALEKIVLKIGTDNYREIEKKLEEQLALEQEKLENEELLHEEYRHTDRKQLERELNHLTEQRDRMAALSTEERLKSVSVVACTLDGYIGRTLQYKIPADHIFLDEAGYANIVKALTLFATGVPVTFLGDHMQLPPVCEMPDPEFKTNSEHRSVFLWAQSAIFLEGLFTDSMENLLIAYLQNRQLPAVKMIKSDLTETFRFGSKLATVLDRYIYRNGFRSANEKASLQIQFIHAPRTDAQRSRISTNEAALIKALTQNLVPDTFVILTPYKKQLKLLGDTMPTIRNEQKILTVHGSQGQEWNTVILSVVDTQDRFFVDTQLQLSKGLNLVNTAVSRVQNRLIIVCDCNYWRSQYGQLIKELLDVAEPFN